MKKWLEFFMKKNCRRQIKKNRNVIKKKKKKAVCQMERIL